VLRRHEGVRTVPGIPVDEKRLSVTDEDIRTYFGSLVPRFPGSHFISCSMWMRWDTKTGRIDRRSPATSPQMSSTTESITRCQGSGDASH
jgi:hypothetical protein